MNIESPDRDQLINTDQHHRSLNNNGIKMHTLLTFLGSKLECRLI